MSDPGSSYPFRTRLWIARLASMLLAISLVALAFIAIHVTLSIRSQTKEVVSVEIGNLYATSPRSDTDFALGKLREIASHSGQRKFWLLWNRVEDKEYVPKSLFWDRSSGKLVYTEKIYTDWGSRALRYTYQGVTYRKLEKLRGKNADLRYLKTLGCAGQVEMREYGKPGRK